MNGSDTDIRTIWLPCIDSTWVGLLSLEATELDSTRTYKGIKEK